MTVRFGSHFSVAGCSWVQVARDSVKNLSCDDNSYNNYSSSDVFFRTINNGSVIVILVDLFLAKNFARLDLERLRLKYTKARSIHCKI